MIGGRRVTVTGAGIAGLAVARALALRGAEVTVFEQAPGIGEVGAGLQISPNGLAVLDALGLGAALRAVAVAGRSVRLLDARGHGVLAMDLARSRGAGRFLFVHRARLIEVLADGAAEAGVRVETGRRIGPQETGEGLFIGADGLHSQTRAALNGRAAPFFTGQVAWRALIPCGDAAPEAQVFMGPGRHLVSYPLGRGLRNIVAVEERRDWADEGWHHRDDPAALRAAFAGFGGPVPEWLAAVETVHLWGLFRHPVADRWHDGTGMAILGDAAHPTLPFLAQGANMALEDAWVLAACLDALPVERALARYQALRRDRVRRAVDAASANARNYHLRGPAAGVAHAGLRVLGALAPGAMLRRFDWLYGHDVTRQPVA